MDFEFIHFIPLRKKDLEGRIQVKFCGKYFTLRLMNKDNRIYIELPIIRFHCKMPESKWTPEMMDNLLQSILIKQFNSTFPGVIDKIIALNKKKKIS